MDFKFLIGQSPLTQEQKQQFTYVVMQGLKSKYRKLLPDENRMLDIHNLWMKYGFHPMDETLSAVDNRTGDILGVVLMNNFKEPGVLKTARCAAETISKVGLQKARSGLKPLRALHKFNQRPDAGVVAEIYLIATDERCRNRGVGSALLEKAIELAVAKCACGASPCACRLMLAVFDRNPAKRLYERYGFREAARMSSSDMADAFGGSLDTILRLELPLKSRIT